MTKGSMRDPTTLTHDTVDQTTLSALAFEPHTRSVFLEAGLEPGMRVLDCWSGVGEVAFVARHIVGPFGQVIGFDQTAGAVAYANERAAGRGFTNVQFVEADVRKLPF